MARSAARPGTALRPADGHCPASRTASARPSPSLPIDRGACQAPRRSGSANAGPGRISPPRSRSGGMVTVVAEIRPARPARKSSGSARLVVAITRTSTEFDPLQPTGRTSPVARTGPAFPGFRRAGRRPRRAGACRRSPRRYGRPARQRRQGKPRACGRTARFRYVGGDRLAVDLDERSLGAQAGLVDGASEGFLAATGLADDQDRQAVACRLGSHRQRSAEFGRSADQLIEHQLRAIFSERGASSPVPRRRSACDASASISLSGQSAWPDNRMRRRASPPPPATRIRGRRAR